MLSHLLSTVDPDIREAATVCLKNTERLYLYPLRIPIIAKRNEMLQNPKQ
jgi:hypothetical protein